MRYYESDEKRLCKSGVAEVSQDDVITSMTEKPAQPKSNWCIPPFYYYPKKDLRLIQKEIESGCGTDAPGSFVAWLADITTVYAMEMPGKRYDIGDINSYNFVQENYNGITK